MRLFSRKKNLEEIKKEHDYEINFKKLKSEIKIENNNIKTRLYLNKLNAKKEKLATEKSIKKLEEETKADEKTVRHGKQLKFWAVLVTIVSTVLTICGGIDNFNKNIWTCVAFILFVILIQFTVFLIASQESKIKENFYIHLWKCNLLKYTLLTVSIYNNYKFFEHTSQSIISKIMTITFCIAFDLIAIFLISLAYDQINLNYFSTKTPQKKNILGMFIYNITFYIRKKVYKKYQTNLSNEFLICSDTKNTKKILQLDTTKDTKEISTIKKKPQKKNTENTRNELSKNDIEKYFNYIFDNKNEDNSCIGYKKVAKEIGIKERTAHYIYRHLKQNKIIGTLGNKTVIIQNNLNNLTYER